MSHTIPSVDDVKQHARVVHKVLCASEVGQLLLPNVALPKVAQPSYAQSLELTSKVITGRGFRALKAQQESSAGASEAQQLRQPDRSTLAVALIGCSEAGHSFWLEHATNRLFIADHSADGPGGYKGRPWETDDGNLYVDAEKLLHSDAVSKDRMQVRWIKEPELLPLKSRFGQTSSTFSNKRDNEIVLRHLNALFKKAQAETGLTDPFIERLQNECPWTPDYIDFDDMPDCEAKTILMQGHKLIQRVSMSNFAMVYYRDFNAVTVLGDGFPMFRFVLSYDMQTVMFSFGGEYNRDLQLASNPQGVPFQFPASELGKYLTRFRF